MKYYYLPIVYKQGGWKKDMEEADAKQLVRDAIAAGIFNDMGSGSNVDLVVIKANDNVQYLRGYDEANQKVKPINIMIPICLIGILSCIQRGEVE